MSRITKLASSEALPLFAADDVIGAWLLGPQRRQEWQQIAPLLEARGLPKIDHLMGGRYTPAIISFFDHLYGLDRGDCYPSGAQHAQPERLASRPSAPT